MRNFLLAGCLVLLAGAPAAASDALDALGSSGALGSSAAGTA